MENDFVDLLTLQRGLQGGIEDLFPERIRVRAEVSSVSVKAGHCYLELSQTEKGEWWPKSGPSSGGTGTS